MAAVISVYPAVLTDAEMLVVEQTIARYERSRKD
jgi:hypothetical protein